MNKNNKTTALKRTKNNKTTALKRTATRAGLKWNIFASDSVFKWFSLHGGLKSWKLAYRANMCNTYQDKVMGLYIMSLPPFAKSKSVRTGPEVINFFHAQLN